MLDLSWQMADEEIKNLKKSGMVAWIYCVQWEDLLDDYVPLEHNLHAIDKGHRGHTGEIGTSIAIKFIGGSPL